MTAGDLTDAKLENFEGSHQSLWEWQQYRRVIHQSGVLNHTVWLDIRGNHGYRAVVKGGGCCKKGCEEGG